MRGLGSLGRRSRIEIVRDICDGVKDSKILVAHVFVERRNLADGELGFSYLQQRKDKEKKKKKKR